MITDNANLITWQKIGTNLAGSFNSNALMVQTYSLLSISLQWSGTFNGSFKIQVSNDSASTPTYWHDISGSTINVASGAYLGQTGFTYSITDVSYRWIRVVYTFTSGTGTLTNCDLVMKGG